MSVAGGAACNNDDAYEAIDGGFSVVNEFAGVTVRKVMTRNGQRLEVRAPLKESVVRLDAVVLEALTYHSPEDFSSMLDVTLGAHEPSRAEAREP